jgi:RNA 3'-terminal phosphate cyclase (ATP)
LRVTGKGKPLSGLQLLERGAIRQVRGLAKVVTELPAHIPQRMANRAENLLQQANLPAQIQPVRERGVAPGAGIFLTAEYEQVVTDTVDRRQRQSRSLVSNNLFDLDRTRSCSWRWRACTG